LRIAANSNSQRANSQQKPVLMSVQPPKPVARDLLGLGLGFIGVALFGATLPMTRIAVVTFDPWFVAVGRAAIASVLAGALLVILHRPLPPRQAWGALAVAALGTVIGFPAFSAVAMQTVPASHGGVVLGLLPLATSIAAVFINDERPSPLFWIWSLVGGALVIAFTLRNGDANFGFGDLWLVIAGACASVGYACFARVAPWLSGWEAICWALVGMTPITIPAAIIAFESAYLDAPMPAIGALLYVSIFSVFIGFFFWNAGLAIGGVAKVGQVQLLQTFVTFMLAAWINHETIDSEMLLFAIAVVAVVLMARRSRVVRPLATG
jgi:drug/metabolite transporter (DMT)-like permease